MPVNATLTALDRAGAAEQAAAAARTGFDCVKVKVGVGDDAGRVAAVRAAAGPRGRAAPRRQRRLERRARRSRAIDALSPAGLELVEEPTHGLQACARCASASPCAWRSTRPPPSTALSAPGVADAVCLKISRCGGIAGLLAAATLVRSSGAEVYLASTLDGPLGVAAALHAAAALSSRGPMPHCGLATLGLFAGIEDPLPARAGRIAVPVGGGLGVDPL